MALDKDINKAPIWKSDVSGTPIEDRGVDDSWSYYWYRMSPFKRFFVMLIFTCLFLALGYTLLLFI
ncbi:MAG: hypothetical protein AAGC88_15625 [Bacteroidota bacterium]